MATTNENLNKPGATSLHGVGGWLLLFVIGTFANVILNLGIVLKGGRPAWGGNIMVYNPAQLVLLAMLALATGVVLLTVRNKNAVLLARIYLGFYLISNILVALFGLQAPSGYYIIDREGLIVKSIMQAVFINLIWQTYFSRSNRVKATYPPLAGAGDIAAATTGKSLSALYDRKVYGIDFFIGGGFFLATMISGILWSLYAPLVQNYPVAFPPASYFLAYRIPLILLYSILLTLLLHLLRNDWLIAVTMGLGTMTLGLLTRVVFSGTRFGSILIGGGYHWVSMINGFMWSFFIMLGLIVALRTWGLKWWSVVAWVVIGGLASDLVSQLLYALTEENFRFDLSSVPMNVIDSAVTGALLCLGIMLHVRKKRTA